MLSCLLTVGGAQAEILDVSDSQFFFNSSLEELQKQSAFALPTNRQCVRLGRALAFYGVTDDRERRERVPDQLSSLSSTACMDLCETLAHYSSQSRSLLESSSDPSKRLSTVNAWPEFQELLLSDEYALANKGHDTRAVQAYLGHKNIQHTVRYTELSPSRFKDFWRN
jgi:hypothetical protein